MAKKKAVNKNPPAKKFALEDTAELLGDGDNPRKISDKAAGGLRNSLKRFGDLSGIVFNKQTGELVCGHQRMDQIRAEYGDQPIEVLDAAAELGIIRIDEQHAFSVRVVDWSRAKQKAANVAANNQKIAGEYTDDLSAYLLDVQAELQEEMPGIFDDVLLIDLIDVDLEEIEEAPEVMHDLRYQVMVECADEQDQADLLERFEKEKRKCKPLIS